jgi:hypothetical protein
VIQLLEVVDKVLEAHYGRQHGPVDSGVLWPANPKAEHLGTLHGRSILSLSEPGNVRGRTERGNDVLSCEAEFADSPGRQDGYRCRRRAVVFDLRDWAFKCKNCYQSEPIPSGIVL